MAVYLASDPDDAMIHTLRYPLCYKCRTMINYTKKVLKGSGWEQKPNELHHGPETQAAEYWKGHRPTGQWFPMHSGDMRLGTEPGFLLETGGERRHLCIRKESEKSASALHRPTAFVKVWPLDKREHIQSDEPPAPWLDKRTAKGQQV